MHEFRDYLCKSFSSKKHERINKFLQPNQYKHMRFPTSSFLFATLSLITVVPAQAASPPPQQLVNFCSTVRDEYTENVRKRYESQRYQGKGGAGASISLKNGLSFGGNGSYDWQRTWDNFDSNKKHQYASKNCDEVLKQWGQVSIAEIQADAEKAINTVKIQKELLLVLI